jgi:hypothetical protein
LIKYIGKPYSFRDYNCWDFVVEARADANIQTRHFKPKTLANAFEIITAQMKKIDNGLTRAEAPENYDIVISCNARRLSLYHCGLYLNGDVFHCDRSRKQVVKDTLAEFINLYGEITFWR